MSCETQVSHSVLSEAVGSRFTDAGRSLFTSVRRIALV